jgi:hypothetical protein
MQDATLDICQQSDTILCQTRPTVPTIRLVLPPVSDLTTTKTSGMLSLAQANTTLVSVSRDGSLLLAPGVTANPDMSSVLGLSLRLSFQ